VNKKNIIGLSVRDQKLLSSVFVNYPEIKKVILFGSRAKGTANSRSDIDLAIKGIDDDLQIEALAQDLDQLPLPYKFDVKSLETIQNVALNEHIKRVGVTIYSQDSH